MSKDFEVNTKLDFLTYVQVVNNIVSEYFDEDGEYTPHIGIAYVMKLFYEKCVHSDKLSEKITDGMSEIAIVNILSEDDDFMDAFNKALSCTTFRMDFANAYSNAMSIVCDKKSSMSRTNDMIERVLNQLVESVTSALSEENLNAVKEITKNLTGGQSTVEAIVNEYVNSGLHKKQEHNNAFIAE